jgi:UDP-glucose-4-epimerase GalE
MSPIVLVTGGAGYIGSHACKALASAGYTPVTYDNLSRGFAHAVKWGPLEIGDLLDRPRLEAVIERHRPEAVMHFAAVAYVGESAGDPALYYRNNLVGTLTLLDAMRTREVDRLVFSSSCTIFGASATVPIAEDAPQIPISPYGATKLFAEQVLRHYAAAYGLRAVAMRYFNAAGADPDGEIGEDHDPETHLIPLVLDAAASGRPLTLNGTDYETPDGTCIRDYVHVSDLAAAHVLACNGLDRAPGLAAYNLGAGVGFSNAEIIETARRRTGLNIEVVAGPRRPGDPAALTADPTRARRELAWTPRFSDVETIIDTAWRWRQHRHALSPGAETCAA